MYVLLVIKLVLLYRFLKPEVVHDVPPPANVHHNLPGLCKPQPLVPCDGFRVVLVHREPRLPDFRLAAQP